MFKLSQQYFPVHLSFHKSAIFNCKQIKIIQIHPGLTLDILIEQKNLNTQFLDMVIYHSIDLELFCVTKLNHNDWFVFRYAFISCLNKINFATLTLEIKTICYFYPPLLNNLLRRPFDFVGGAGFFFFF